MAKTTSTERRSSTAKRNPHFSNERTSKVLHTVENRLRRIAKRRGTAKAAATYREAADLVHQLFAGAATKSRA